MYSSQFYLFEWGQMGLCIETGDVDLGFLGFREMKRWEWITNEKLETVISKILQNSFHISDKAGTSMLGIIIIIGLFDYVLLEYNIVQN